MNDKKSDLPQIKIKEEPKDPEKRKEKFKCPICDFRSNLMKDIPEHILARHNIKAKNKNKEPGGISISLKKEEDLVNPPTEFPIFPVLPNDQMILDLLPKNLKLQPGDQIEVQVRLPPGMILPLDALPPGAELVHASPDQLQPLPPSSMRPRGASSWGISIRGKESYRAPDPNLICPEAMDKDGEDQQVVGPQQIIVPHFMTPDTNFTTASGAPAATCRECGQVFSNMKSLSSHIITDHTKLFNRQGVMKTNSHQTKICDGCNKTFYSVQDVISHTKYKCKKLAQKKGILSTQEPHVDVPDCHFCKKSFDTHDELMQHVCPLNTVLNEGFSSHLDEYFCPKGCPTKFYCQETMEAHLASYHNCPVQKSGGRVQCLGCPMNFSSVKKRNEHEKMYHSAEDLRLNRKFCMDCNQRFDDDTKFSMHVNEQHSGMFKCPLCGNILQNLARLGFHMKNIHSEVPLNSCPVPNCGLVLINKVAFEKHCVNAHTSITGDFMKPIKIKRDFQRILPSPSPSPSPSIHNQPVQTILPDIVPDDADDHQSLLEPIIGVEVDEVESKTETPEIFQTEKEQNEIEEEDKPLKPSKLSNEAAKAEIIISEQVEEDFRKVKATSIESEESESSEDEIVVLSHKRATGRKWRKRGSDSQGVFPNKKACQNNNGQGS